MGSNQDVDEARATLNMWRHAEADSVSRHRFTTTSSAARYGEC
jgi:hypothetical protein